MKGRETKDHCLLQAVAEGFLNDLISSFNHGK